MNPLDESLQGPPPPLPEKSARFRRNQYRKLLAGELRPPKNKKWGGSLKRMWHIQSLLDKVTMELKVTNRAVDKEEISRTQYDHPRRLDQPIFG